MKRVWNRRDVRDRSKRDRDTIFDSGEFVAIDGEGFNEGEETTIKIKARSREETTKLYRGKEHFYAYLAASDGSEIYSPTRLRLGDCLQFLCSIVERNPRAIVVIFGGSYDVTQMMCHDLTAEEIKALLSDEDTSPGLHVDIDGYQYKLEYRPRKVLTVYRWEAGDKKYEWKNGHKKMTTHLRVQLWDVWGFFQLKFTDAMEQWLPNDPDYKMIVREKARRDQFQRSELDAIRKYNAAELRCLVKIMENVRAGVNDLGLTLRRWDGAGAIAAAMMQKYEVKKAKAECPKEVFEASRYAYSGGHIEVMKIGYHSGSVYHYDINSAYPSIFRLLPDLSIGQWTSGNGSPPAGFTLVRVRYSFPWGRPFYPLFYRKYDGSIIYPDRGEGWYWHPEYEAAKLYMEKLGGKCEAVEWWHFEPVNPPPFQWVEEIYKVRQSLKDGSYSGVMSPAVEKVIKLGLNSLYGKTAQQIGAKWDGDGNLNKPPYFQLEWAGYVTAGCRAQLMMAAIQSPNDVIAFATDGIFSRTPLDLYTPQRKELGAWEYKKHDGITMVMPGVYWLHDGETKENFSRGYKKSEMSDPEFVHQAWRQKRKSIPVSVERLIGLGSAAASPQFWQLRGRFVHSSRSLKLDGNNSKRSPVMLYNNRPERGLVSAEVRTHEIDLYTDDLFSAPYPISWLDDSGSDPKKLYDGLAEESEQLDAILA